ncbi:MAG: tRNA (N(6)-L-threonylcarbamoyladenosine(37)-C(2))-methylthiotransferase MtaB [Anaerolineae bacterium]|nr:tRNA (N(6)-L-threonylcarbamoyladenosine(37)-C(2))-methylthiotransferase MtaB [Anaerolineae bacterium]
MNIYLDTIGCRLNQSEIERLGAQFRDAGHDLVGAPEDADIIVVNTCTVTHKAASDSRQMVRRVGRASSAQIVVTGCWATMEPDSATSLPSVHRVIDNLHKEELARSVLNIPGTNIPSVTPRQPLPGDRRRTRAFIKCQDGCNRACTYCITRIARGKNRSQPLDEIIGDIRSAIAGGVREVVLTGVQLGAWGQDLEDGQNMVHLIRAILERTDIPRVRLSSVEPWDLTQDFFDLFKDPRLCRHLHLPLQSGNPITLRRMARKTNLAEYQRYVEMARAVSPDIAITTDVIVGFPGENNHQFDDSLAFIEQIGFAQGHVFTYSARPGTPAASYPDQITPSEKKRRSGLMHKMFQQAAERYRRKFIGSSLPVLWETSQKAGTDWMLEGLSDNYLRVVAKASEDRWNQVDQAHLQEIDNGKFIACLG